jgi:hypothetical protein
VPGNKRPEEDSLHHWPLVSGMENTGILELQVRMFAVLTPIFAYPMGLHLPQQSKNCSRKIIMIYESIFII